MNKLILLLLSFIVLIAPSEAQNPKFWIKLTDKNGTPYSVSTPTAFLTQKSIQRRVNQGISINESDLPVNPTYVSQISSVANVKLLYCSKWLNAVAVEITSTVSAAISTATNAINAFSFVINSEPVNKFKVIYEKEQDFEFATELNKTTQVNNYYGGAWRQANQIKADCMHGYGYRGQGMVIAVLDAGFRNVDVLAAFDSLRARNGILGTRDFVSGGTSVYEDNSHGTNVLSCMAALVPNVMVGTAPRADYWLIRTEDVATETPSEEYNWIRGAEFADSVGADILTTSLGYTTFDKAAYNHTISLMNGKTYPMSIASTMAARKGMFVLNSAGNDGNSPWQFIGVPADADSICTVGAIDSLGNYANFSSKGPTADGRIKPDLVARGHRALVATQSGSYLFGNGTSFSCPVLAGAVACFWQRHNTFNNIKVLDTLRKTASNNANPNNNIGWGIPNMCALPVGIMENLSHKTDWKLHPVPFSDNIYLTLNNQKEAVNIEMYDVTGSIVKTAGVVKNEKQITISTGDLPPGVYLIKIYSEFYADFRKAIKQ